MPDQHATPIANLFIERGRPATFLTELSILIESMEAATQYKHHGHLKQVASTAGIKSEARCGVKIMRELDAILTDLLEENESHLAAWKTAAKIESAPEVEGELLPKNIPHGEWPREPASPCEADDFGFSAASDGAVAGNAETYSSAAIEDEALFAAGRSPVHFVQIDQVLPSGA